MLRPAYAVEYDYMPAHQVCGRVCVHACMCVHDYMPAHQVWGRVDVSVCVRMRVCVYI